MDRKSLKFKNEELFLEVGQYRNNGNIAIIAYTKDDLYGDITINLSGYSIDENEGFIQPINKDSGLENTLIKKGIIKEVIATVNYNMGMYDMVAFDVEKLKEYDPLGVAKYQQNIEKEEKFE